FSFSGFVSSRASVAIPARSVNRTNTGARVLASRFFWYLSGPVAHSRAYRDRAGSRVVMLSNGRLPRSHRPPETKKTSGQGRLPPGFSSHLPPLLIAINRPPGIPHGKIPPLTGAAPLQPEVVMTATA